MGYPQLIPSKIKLLVPVSMTYWAAYEFCNMISLYNKIFSEASEMFIPFMATTAPLGVIRKSTKTRLLQLLICFFDQIP